MLTIFNLILIRILKNHKGNLFNQKKNKNKNEIQLCFVHIMFVVVVSVKMRGNVMDYCVF